MIEWNLTWTDVFQELCLQVMSSLATAVAGNVLFVCYCFSRSGSHPYAEQDGCIQLQSTLGASGSFIHIKVKRE